MSKNNYFKSSMGVLAISIGIKAVGFFKQVVIGSFLGATELTDTYFISYEFAVSLIFVLLSSVSVSFIPLYQKMRHRSCDGANGLVSGVLVGFGAVLAVLTLLIFAFSSEVASLLVGGNEEIPLAVMDTAIKVMSGVVFFGGINTILGALLEANLVFSYSKVFGLILSLTLMPLIVLFSDEMGVDVLFWGTLISYVVHLAVLVFGVRRHTDYGFRRYEKGMGFSALIIATLPLMVGNGVYQIANMVDKVIAASVGTGVASSLAYAQTISDSICAITITSIVSVMFAYASKFVSEARTEELNRLVSTTAEILLIVCVPFAVILFSASDSIVSIAFGRGAFDERAVEMSSLALKGTACGMPFLVFREVFSRVHYAYSDTKTPLINGAIALLIHVPLSYTLSRCLGILGITIGSAASFLVCGLLILVSARKYVKYSFGEHRSFYARIFIASGVSVVVPSVVLGQLHDLSPILSLAITCSVTAVSFLLLLGNILRTDLKGQAQLK